MATEAIRRAVQGELKASAADKDATLAELLGDLDAQNLRLGKRRLSDEQHEELSIYCWALTHRRSSPFVYGENGAWPYDELGG
jgi:hypothetical protein